MSRENCKACSPCNRRNYPCCDNCDASCCQENMKKHEEIFWLCVKFYHNVDDAENELTTKVKKISDNLKIIDNYLFHTTYGVSVCEDFLDNMKNKYNVMQKLEYSLNNQINDGVSHCENFLDNMKNKYNVMQNLEYSLNNQINQNKTNFEEEKRKISFNYEIELRKLKDSFEEKKAEIADTKGKRNKDIEKNITTKEETKKELEDKKENIKSTNINEIVNDYINREKPQIENEYQNQKNIIDDKNKIEIVNLEYTEEEKNLENYYLNTICNIKNYSKKIPFFDDWMKAYNLNNYIN